MVLCVLNKRIFLFFLFFIINTPFLSAEGKSLDGNNLTKGGAYSYSPQNYTIIGVERTYTIKGDETLLEVARLFGLGFNEIRDANPEIDPWIPTKGTKILIPTMWILPELRDDGIVINLAEMRLYYFFGKRIGYRMVRTFPIGIGREGFYTPLGLYSITEKIRNPTWYPPLSSIKDDPSLPRLIPPGPDNPLGGYWLQLSQPGYGIHGTNKPWGIGRMVSSGCIRLYPEDIPWLFNTVKLGTPVEIINNPVKIGYRGNKLYIEVHKNNRTFKSLYKEALSLIKRLGGPYNIDYKGLQTVIKKETGVPTLISK